MENGKEQVIRENKAFLSGMEAGLNKAETYITTYPGLSQLLKDPISQWFFKERQDIINAPVYEEVSYGGEPLHESKYSPRYNE